MSTLLLVTFSGGQSGDWSVTTSDAVIGPGLPDAAALTVHEGDDAMREDPGTSWSLRGVVSHERYVNQEERTALEASQQGLGRASSTRAVLLPIRKSARWWALTQQERREIFEERSRHIHTGLLALPAVARRLHHSRDLGEPFDFLTWFEFAPEGTALFDDVLARLRASEEWRYVDREVEVRLSR